MLAASPASLSAHKDDYIKMIKVWDRVMHYINDPKTQADAVKIMSKRVGLTPAEYLPLLKGTKLLDVAAGKKTFKKGEGLDSLYGSTKNACDGCVEFGDAAGDDGDFYRVADGGGQIVPACRGRE